MRRTPYADATTEVHNSPGIMGFNTNYCASLSTSPVKFDFRFYTTFGNLLVGFILTTRST